MPTTRSALSRFGVLAACLGFALGAAPRVAAQENYEIQVYGSETIPRGVTMYELHSNYTLSGRRGLSEFGEYPTYHAIHETVEITHGFNDWFEIGFYQFTAKPDGRSFAWVGTHIRPRVRAPESWGWPVGVSISQEIGYARPQYSADTWTYELRPIIDKQIGLWYVSLNPVLGKSLRGPNSAEAFDFTPNVDVGYDVTKKVNLVGRVLRSDGHDQTHRADRRPAAPGVRRRESRPRAGVGVQLRVRNGAHGGRR